MDSRHQIFSSKSKRRALPTSWGLRALNLARPSRIRFWEISTSPTSCRWWLASFSRMRGDSRLGVSRRGTGRRCQTIWRRICSGTSSSSGFFSWRPRTCSSWRTSCWVRATNSWATVDTRGGPWAANGSAWCWRATCLFCWDRTSTCPSWWAN